MGTPARYGLELDPVLSANLQPVMPVQQGLLAIAPDHQRLPAAIAQAGFLQAGALLRPQWYQQGMELWSYFYLHWVPSDDDHAHHATLRFHAERGSKRKVLRVLAITVLNR
jgi:hypothetical protein